MSKEEIKSLDIQVIAETEHYTCITVSWNYHINLKLLELLHEAGYKFLHNIQYSQGKYAFYVEKISKEA